MGGIPLNCLRGRDPSLKNMNKLFWRHHSKKGFVFEGTLQKSCFLEGTLFLSGSIQNSLLFGRDPSKKASQDVPPWNALNATKTNSKKIKENHEQNKGKQRKTKEQTKEKPKTIYEIQGSLKN